jgi:hypothetical protein
MGSQEVGKPQLFPESAISSEADAEEHFQSMVKAALMALFDDPQIQQRVVLMLRNRIRSEPSLLR